MCDWCYYNVGWWCSCYYTFIDVAQHHDTNNLHNAQQQHFPLAFIALAIPIVVCLMTTILKEGNGVVAMGGPFSLLASCKLFLLFLHKQNISFHILGTHASLGF